MHSRRCAVQHTTNRNEVLNNKASKNKNWGEDAMKSRVRQPACLLESSTAGAAGLVLSPAIIGRAEAATLKFKCSSSLPNDPKYANGRVYYDNLVKHLKGNGPRRADRGHVLSRQPVGPGNRRHQFGQARRDRPDDVGLVDLGQLVPLVGTFDLGYLFTSFPQQTKAFEPAPPSRSRRRCSRAATSASSPRPIISARAACWRGSR